MRMGDTGQPSQALLGASGDLCKGARLQGGHLPQRLLLALREGLGAQGLNLLGGKETLLPRLRLGHVAAAVEDSVKAEFFEDGLAHQ